MSTSKNTYTCPKCGSLMKGGFLTGHILQKLLNTAAQPVKWVEGTGEKNPLSTLSVLLGKSERHQVITYRCEECGYLESYIPSS